MRDHQKPGLRKAIEIDRDDPIFSAFGLDPEQVAAALHRPRRISGWLLLAIFGIIAPLVGFIMFHWPDMAHAAVMAPAENVQAAPVSAQQRPVPQSPTPQNPTRQNPAQ